jgi:hypothetical protein
VKKRSAESRQPECQARVASEMERRSASSESATINGGVISVPGTRDTLLLTQVSCAMHPARRWCDLERTCASGSVANSVESQRVKPKRPMIRGNAENPLDELDLTGNIPPGKPAGFVPSVRVHRLVASKRLQCPIGGFPVK